MEICYYKSSWQIARWKFRSYYEEVTRTGSFIGAGDGFHNAEGLAKVILVDDSGHTILRLENFKSTNGPNVHLYLATDKAASNFIDLGRLKANNGNQNYNIPVGTDLAKYNLALIWCKDFSVLFGSAQLKTWLRRRENLSSNLIQLARRGSAREHDV